MLRSGGAGTVTTMAQEPDLPPPNAGFEVVRRGYDQGQVDNHLRRLDAEIQILATDRDAALDQSAQLARELDDARARAERLRVQVRSLVSPPQSVQGMSERMRSMLRLAEDEAGEMLSRAEQEIAQRRREAEAHAARGTRRRPGGSGGPACGKVGPRPSARLRRSAGPGPSWTAEIAAAREQLAADRAAASDQIAADRDRATRERETAWATSETRRKVIEEDFTIAMNRRRAEALTQLTAEQKRLQLAGGGHPREVREGGAQPAGAGPPGRPAGAGASARLRSDDHRRGPPATARAAGAARPNPRAARRHPQRARGIPRRVGAAARGVATGRREHLARRGRHRGHRGPGTGRHVPRPPRATRGELASSRTVPTD